MVEKPCSVRSRSTWRRGGCAGQLLSCRGLSTSMHAPQPFWGSSRPRTCVSALACFRLRPRTRRHAGLRRRSKVQEILQFLLTPSGLLPSVLPAPAAPDFFLSLRAPPVKNHRKRRNLLGGARSVDMGGPWTRSFRGQAQRPQSSRGGRSCCMWSVAEANPPPRSSLTADSANLGLCGCRLSSTS